MNDIEILICLRTLVKNSPDLKEVEEGYVMAINNALAALREKAARDDPHPLTLEKQRRIKRMNVILKFMGASMILYGALVSVFNVTLPIMTGCLLVFCGTWFILSKYSEPEDAK